jgi:hypothetical protein
LKPKAVKDPKDASQNKNEDSKKGQPAKGNLFETKF